MMSKIFLVLALCAATAYCQCDGYFTRHPESQEAALGDNIQFICDLDEMHINYPRTYRFYPLSGGSTDIFGNELLSDRGYERVLNISTEGNIPSILRVHGVEIEHVGRYACLATLDGCGTIFSANATLTIIGKPKIAPPPSNTLEEETTQDLRLILVITGTQPDVSVYLIEDDSMTAVTMETHPRIEYNYEMDKLLLTIEDLRRSDAGQYFIEAVNDYGRDNITITVAPQGPDPPVVSLQSVAVSDFTSPLSIQCSVSNHEEAGGLLFTWSSSDGVISPGGSISIDSSSANSSTLTFSSLTENDIGIYTCLASNIRGNHTGVVQVFGPPPTLSDAPDITGTGIVRTISWSRPNTAHQLEPITSYEVKIYSGSTDSVSFSQTVTDLDFVVPVLVAGDYTVTITPISMLEGQDPVYGEESQRASFTITKEEFPIIPVIIGVVAGVAIIVAIGVSICIFFMCFYYPHRRQLRSQEQSWSGEDAKTDGAVQNEYTSMTLRPSSEFPASPGMSSPTSSSFLLDIDPKWEFPRENIKLYDTLCTGQFTNLYKGVATGIKENAVDVAVKAVRDEATEDDVKALMAEMELLSSIGTHENLLSMIRVCTVGKPMYMVMEYMCHGDLLGFLRASRGHYGRYTVSPGVGYQPPAINLYPRDLLNIGAKIASGMTYLADRKLVHRSLCAKNVLVGSNMSIKICNVGSFDMVVESEYIMKWMAPETLFDQTATTYSDVWSFGVTLWELVTVGGNPYGDTTADQLYSKLINGMRMTCPEHCSPEIHDLMLECWMRNPMDRLHFSEIYEKLDDLAMSKLNLLDFQNYDVNVYSKFEEPAPLLTVL